MYLRRSNRIRSNGTNGRQIKYLQSDEYCNIEFDHYLVKSGIEHRLTVPHSTAGMAERFNHTL